MSDFTVEIVRKRSFSQSIGGELLVAGQRICYTLELPWRWNMRSRSCVPNGMYPGFLRYDKTDGWRIQLTGVPGRSGVQIHIGNYPRHTKGCVLVGTGLQSNQVTGSGAAYELLKAAFYGSSAPEGSPGVSIRVRFRGAMSTPWGDFTGALPAAG